MRPYNGISNIRVERGVCRIFDTFNNPEDNVDAISCTLYGGEVVKYRRKVNYLNLYIFYMKFSRIWGVGFQY